MGYGLYLPPFFPPNASYSNNARNVNTDGSLNNNNAYNGNNGVRPAHAENRVTVGNETSSEISGPHKERISRRKRQTQEGRRLRRRLRGSRLHAPGLLKYEKQI